VGDLAADTAVEPLGDGRYRAVVSHDWEIWGPNGGYLAAIALRAAGCSATFRRPASISCRFFAVAAFAPVELTVTVLRTSLWAESLRVVMSQRDRPVLEVNVWAVAGLPGPRRAWTAMPVLPPPQQLRSLEEEAAAIGQPAVAFWRNLEIRAVRESVGPDGRSEPAILAWQRFRPRATFDDPWVDACRHVVLLDTGQFPAVTRGFTPAELDFIAPTLDFYVAFLGEATGHEWLLGETRGVAAADGLIAARGQIWTADGDLVAAGTQQMMVVPARRSARGPDAAALAAAARTRTRKDPDG
jgi:acyl-CoA thioesterase